MPGLATGMMWLTPAVSNTVEVTPSSARMARFGHGPSQPGLAGVEIEAPLLLKAEVEGRILGELLCTGPCWPGPG